MSGSMVDPRLADRPRVFANLQVLRALAAFWVMLHHGGPHYVAMGGSLDFLTVIGDLGFLGVDVFFVISGFIMVHTMKGSPSTPVTSLSFLRRRLIRIYSGYWPLLLVAYALQGVSGLWSPDSQLWPSVFLTAHHHGDHILPTAWTLAFEQYFYVLFAVFLLIPRFQAWSLAVGIPLVLVVGPILGVEGLWLHPLVLEFLAGMGVACWFGDSRSRVVLWIAAVSAVSIFAAGVAAGAQDGVARVLYFGSAATCLLLFMVVADNRTLFRPPRLLVSLGDASYSLYLIHYIGLKLLSITGLQALLARLGGLSVELGYAAVLAVICTVSVIYYRVVERPLYQGVLRRVKRHGSPNRS
jgi:exopolysaccharide production protein ExoZ